jgi:transcriptional regulator with XRE-family HTH domain
VKDRAVARAFGKELRAARIARGLSQEALAAEAGVDRTYPSLLERGLREPTLEVFFRLCAAVRRTPIDLLALTLARLPARYARQWLILDAASDAARARASKADGAPYTGGYP